MKIATTLALLSVALLGLLAYALGPQLSTEPFFLIPILLASWSSGRQAGILIAILSAVAWTLADTFANPSAVHTLASVWNPAVKLALFLTVANLIPLAKGKLEREEESARTDFLTGALNKKSFLDLVQVEIERSRRYKHPFTLAYLDIDHLKFINERFGHSIGDRLLQSTAKTIREKTRAMDTTARIGEDEFALLFPETQPEPAQVVTRRIQKSLYEMAQKNEWPVTFSIGVVTFLIPPSSVEEMTRKADHLLFAAKNSGKNMVKHEIVSTAPVSS